MGNSLSTSIGTTVRFTAVPAEESRAVGGVTVPPLVVVTEAGAGVESGRAADTVPEVPAEPPWLCTSAPARSEAVVQPPNSRAASGTNGTRTRSCDERRDGTGRSGIGDDEMY
jgi:hypothetical protein